jgi:mono/diheme cytochrome c family protein
MTLRLVAALALAILLPAASVSATTPAPKIVGSAKLGKKPFVSTCGVCHTLRAAATVGAIGPNLDHVALTEQTIIKAITNGGATVMPKAIAAKYTTQMVAYKNVLSTRQIDNIAAYVYTSTHKTGAT